MITDGIDGLRIAGIIGGLLAVAVLFFFLRRFDSTFIVSLSIPFSVVATCGVLYFMDKTLNILSMMGLMLGVGMLVDNAIVVLESIDRTHRTERDTKKAARHRRRPRGHGGDRLDLHLGHRLPAAHRGQRHRAHHLARRDGDRDHARPSSARSSRRSP